MKKKGLKLIVLAIAAVFVSVTLLAGCGASSTAGSSQPAQTSSGDSAKKLPVVGISTGSAGTSWRNEMIDALKQVGDQYKSEGKIADYQIVNNNTNGDATEQANIIRNFIAKKVNIILLDPNSPDALNGVIKEAQDAGILVIPFDATVTAPNVTNVTLDHYAWNTKLVDFVASTLKKGNVIQVYGIDGHPANNARIQATADVLKNYPDIKMIASTSGYWDETKAKEVTTQIIGSGKQIDGVITQDSMAYGVLSAFEDAGKLPKVMVGDPGTAFFKEWKKLRDEKADFKAVAEPNPPGIGGTAFEIALNLYNGKQFKDGVLKDGTYYYQVSSLFTDANFDEGYALVKDKPDDYLLTEIMPQDKVDALFK